MKNLTNRTRITVTEEVLSIHVECISALACCEQLRRDDLLSKYIRRKIFEELCNPYNIVTCDFKFTEEPNMN